MGIPAPPTLARILTTQGYQTAAFYNASIFFCDDKRATAYGARRFDFQYAETELRQAPALTDRVLRYLARQRGLQTRQPFFLWVHYFDVHEPYLKHPGLEFGDRPVDRYDSEIALVDRSVGRLVAALSPVERPTLFVLTADHGEEFKDHGGSYHGSTLYEEQIRVPLIIGVPGVKPRVVKEPVELVDVMPTMLSLLGLRIPESVRGESLVPELLGRPLAERMAFSEVHTKKMVRYKQLKLIHDFRRSTHELYDLSSDPGERQNLIDKRPRDAARLRTLLYRWFDALRTVAASVGGEQRPEAIDLGRIGDRRAVPRLGELVNDMTLPTRWRREAAQLLGQLQDRRGADPLFAAVADDDPEVAAEAAIALGEMQDRRAGLVLPAVLRQSDDDLRRRAGIAMARIDGPGVTPALLEALYSRNWELQNRAVHYLGFQGDRQAIDPLLRMARRPHLRSRIALALGRLGSRLPDGRIAPFLLSLVERDTHTDVRQRALAGLGHLGDRRAIRPLLRLLPEVEGELTWLPETLSRLGALGGWTVGVDLSAVRRGQRSGWGACQRQPSLVSEDYVGSTTCTMNNPLAVLEVQYWPRSTQQRLLARVRPARALAVNAKLLLQVNGQDLLPAAPLKKGWQLLGRPAPERLWKKGKNKISLKMIGIREAPDDRGLLEVDYLLLVPDASNRGQAGRVR